jgi:hypothetical protein
MRKATFRKGMGGLPDTELTQSGPARRQARTVPFGDEQGMQ